MLFLYSKSRRLQLQEFEKYSISQLTICNRPVVPHGEDLPIPSAPDSLDTLELSDNELQEKSYTDDTLYEPELSNEPQLFDQKEVNDLVRDLDLSKESAELLGSRLKAKNLLAPCFA